MVIIKLLIVLTLISSIAPAQQSPNVLVVIAEDMSWAHLSAYGEQAIETKSFDELAKNGVLFKNAFCPAPSCGPSRSGILTGRPIWQLGPAASIYTPLPPKYPVYQDALEAAGYKVGFAGKGWGPGNFEGYGRSRNPAGPEYNQNDKSSYWQNFEAFLEKTPQNKPFSFWIGTSDAHRPFAENAYTAYEIDLAQVVVPEFLPDTPEVRKEIADYLAEVKKFDTTLGKIINVLKQQKKLDNTILIVTADHGWSFPRGKGSLYEYGMHVPLLIHWPQVIAKAKRVNDFVNLTELAPTILEIAGVEIPSEMTAKSFKTILLDDKTDWVTEERRQVYLGHERHSPYRIDGLGYPMRAIRNERFCYIWNEKPDRWPAGAPPHYADPSDHMIVGSQIIESKDQIGNQQYFNWCYAKRPYEELYDMLNDPFQLNNLSEDKAFQKVKTSLKIELQAYLASTHDPRTTSNKTLWDTMPWIGRWKYPEYKPKNHDQRVKKFEKRYRK